MTLNHSFNVHLATKYGMAEAILIAHFQYWITHNKNLGRNFKEGKTWTYQTRREIAAHFPYLDENSVRRLCERLVDLKIIETRNFNKKGFDKTLWYAFVNEEEMIVDSKKVYERQNCHSENINENPGEIQKKFTKGKIAIACGKIATPIPDTKTNTKTDVLYCADSPPVADSPQWEKIEKIDLKGKKFFVCRNDLTSLCVMKNLDWTQEEIILLWNILVKYPNPISDWFLFCQGTLKKIRTKEKINSFNQDEKCQRKKLEGINDKKPLLKNTKKTISESVIWTPLLGKYNSLEELMGG